MTDETPRCEPPPEWRDRDGWHWVERHDLPPVCRYWSVDGDSGLPSNAPGWANLEMRARGWRYHSPVTPPAVAAAMAKALEECADDLKALVMHEYGSGPLTPGNALRLARDLEPVAAAQRALAAYRGEA